MRPLLIAFLLWMAVACSSGTSADADPVTAPTPATSSSTSASMSSSSSSMSDPTAGGSTDSDAPAVSDPIITPEGFRSVAATVTTEAGEVCEVCIWLADTNDLRARGLMFVTDLGGADGMAFVYPTPHTGTFWMRNTVTPLSIAFFAPDGAYLDAFDMEPCTTDPCLQYATPSDFSVAIEVFQGDLAALGIAPGSTLELSDLPCEPDA